MDVSALSSVRPSAHAGGPLTGAALRRASPAEQRTAVAAQFEAIIVRQLLGPTMSKMLGSEKSTAGSVYGDLLTDTLATQLTAGPGLGLGRMIQQQLTPRGVEPPSPEDPAAVDGGKS